MPRFINTFHLRNIKGDIYGGVTAGLIALPLGLAFGVSSGAGAIAGLYSAVLVGLFASIFGGTASQISGPTGPMTVVMAGVITSQLASDPEGGLAKAFTMVVLAGCFQILFGLLKLGKYIIQVSYPVISGFMSGIGVIIISLQLRPLLGSEILSNPLDAILDLPLLMQQGDMPSMLIGGMTLITVFIWRGKLNDWLPSTVLVLIVGTLASNFMPVFHDLPVIGNIPSGFPSLMIPHVDISEIRNIVATAILLAMLGSIDSLLTSLVADDITRTHHDSDKELVGQGLGNIVAGLFGALPGAGATMRTVVNVRAGGETAISGVVHSMVLLIIILGAATIAEKIPHAVLAGILIKVGFDIIDRRFLKRLHRVPLFSAGMMVAVLVLTVFVDLITAVAIGVFVTNMVTIERLTHVQLDGIRLTDKLSQKTELDSGALDNGKLLLLELHGPMSFGVARGINRRLMDYHKHQVLLIDVTNAVFVGVTTSLVLLDIIDVERDRGNIVVLVGANKASVRKPFRRLGILEEIPWRQRFGSLENGLKFATAYVEA